tara:strand:- start:4644 stop:5300 length:657 start_codon:yes stop_codon:yes gene_type:complete
MKGKIIISILLLIFLSTITFKEKITIKKFNLDKIIIKNNSILKKKELEELLVPIYGKNLLLLNNTEIKKILSQNSFIDSFDIKKIYPNILKIKIYEKNPIAILIDKKKKYLLSEQIDLINFETDKIFKDLPYVRGNQNEFKIFYNNLKEIDFPLDLVKEYTFYDTGRWDIETLNGKIIKLPSKNYINKLRNFLDLRTKSNFKKYKIFDYRINNQIILK